MFSAPSTLASCRAVVLSLSALASWPSFCARSWMSDRARLAAKVRWVTFWACWSTSSSFSWLSVRLRRISSMRDCRSMRSRPVMLAPLRISSTSCSLSSISVNSCVYTPAVPSCLICRAEWIICCVSSLSSWMMRSQLSKHSPQLSQ
uniref:Uncharacterized protein n=1 Tax=Ixodes ricinus TaxID=34613 RepID=A0A147BSE0_IXORI